MEMDFKPPASPHDGPPARAYRGYLQLASFAASPVRRFRRRKRPSAPRPYAPVNRGQRTGPPGLPRTSRLAWASGAYGGVMRSACVREPALRQRIYTLMMPGSVRHNNSMHGRLRARRAVVLVNLLQRRALARNAGAVMRTLAGLEQKEMDFETARIPARWAAGAH